VDGLAQILGVVRPAKGAGQARGGEDERQDLPVELADLGVRLHERPSAPLDLCQGLQDLGPRAAEYFHVGVASGG
jgi:hypothetical protein